MMRLIDKVSGIKFSEKSHEKKNSKDENKAKTIYK